MMKAMSTAPIGERTGDKERKFPTAESPYYSRLAIKSCRVSPFQQPLSYGSKYLDCSELPIQTANPSKKRAMSSIACCACIASGSPA